MKIFTLRDTMQPVPMPANPINNGVNMDPVTIISTVSAGWSLIANLFGSSRKRLTMADWNQMFPYSGTWYNKLKNYYYAHIQYNTDEGNISTYLIYFLYDSGLVDTTNQNVSQREQTAMTWLQNELTSERNGISSNVNIGYVKPPATTQTGTNTTTTITGPGGSLISQIGSGNSNIFSPYLIIGGIALAFLIFKK